MSSQITIFFRACLVAMSPIISAQAWSFSHAEAGIDLDSHFVLQDDFEPSTAGLKFDRGALLGTSTSTKFYQLKAEKQGYSADSQWIVKENELHWLIHEYIASKLYALILGDDLISDIVWVSDKKDENRSYIAVQYDPVLLHFVKDQESEQRRIMNAFSFSCLLNKCQATGLSVDRLKEYAVAKTKNPYSTIDGKRIKGGELAILASVLLNDQDIAWGQNFALKKQDSTWEVTRIDFDTSLSFFDSLGISPGTTPASLVKSHGIPLNLAETVASMVNAQMSRYYPVSSSTFSEQFPNIDSLQDIHGFTRNSRAMRNAMKTIIDLNLEQVEQVVQQAIDDIKPYISDELLSQYYDFGGSWWDSIQFLIPFNSSSSTSRWDLIKAFILTKVSERQLQIKSIYDASAPSNNEL